MPTTDITQENLYAIANMTEVVLLGKNLYNSKHNAKLIDALTANKNNTTLIISGCAFTDPDTPDDVTAFEELCKRLVSIPHIHTLTIFGGIFTADSAVHCLAFYIQSSRYLHNLCLNIRLRNKGVRILANALAKNKKLETLELNDLRHSYKTSRDLLTALISHQSLRHLTLTEDFYEGAALAKMLRSPDCQLQFLQLDDIGLSEDADAASHWGFLEADAEVLGQALAANRSLRFFAFNQRKNQVEMSGREGLIILKHLQNHPSLEELEFSMTDFFRYQASEMEMEQEVGTWVAMPALRRLSVGPLLDDWCDDYSLRRLSNFIEKNTTLLELTLKISLYDVTFIAEALFNHPNLSQFDLMCDFLDDYDAVLLAVWLAHNQTLTSFKWHEHMRGYSSLSNWSKTLLRDALMENDQLLEFSLDRKEEKTQAVKDKLKQNQQHHKAWVRAATTIASLRANQNHALQYSILALLPDLDKMISSEETSPPVECEFKADPFIDSRYCRENIKTRTQSESETTKTQTNKRNYRKFFDVLLILCRYLKAHKDKFENRKLSQGDYETFMKIDKAFRAACGKLFTKEKLSSGKTEFVLKTAEDLLQACNLWATLADVPGLQKETHAALRKQPPAAASASPSSAMEISSSSAAAANFKGAAVESKQKGEEAARNALPSAAAGAPISSAMEISSSSAAAASSQKAQVGSKRKREEAAPNTLLFGSANTSEKPAPNTLPSESANTSVASMEISESGNKDASAAPSFSR